MTLNYSHKIKLLNSYKVKFATTAKFESDLKYICLLPSVNDELKKIHYLMIKKLFDHKAAKEVLKELGIFEEKFWQEASCS